MIEDAHKGKRQFLSGMFFFFPVSFDFSFGRKKGVGGSMVKEYYARYVYCMTL